MAENRRMDQGAEPWDDEAMGDLSLLVAESEQDGRLLAAEQMLAEGGDAMLLDEERSLLDEAGVGEDDMPWATEDPTAWQFNLALEMPETERTRLGSKVVEWVRKDKESRADWERRETKGIRMLGVTERTLGGATFKGASDAVHPGLVQACIEFQARAMAELWPAAGPVKTVVVGDSDEEKEAQAQRVEHFLNYQYTTDMPGAFDETDRLLFRLPMSGSVFKKAYYDPLERSVVTRFVEADDFLAPYSATDLRTAPRFTHQFKLTRNELRRAEVEGLYLPTVDTAPDDELREHDQLDAVSDEAEGRQPVHGDEEHEAEYDNRDLLYECYAILDLEDYDTEDPLVAGLGYGVPYVVTVHHDRQEVVAVRRNWQPDDARYRRQLYFSHYKFLPGLGFYGFGFFHVASGLSKTQTGALRALLDSAMLANSQGGYKSEDLRLPGGDQAYDPNAWVDVKASSEEMAKGFYRPPYKEPSSVLFGMLEYLDGGFGRLVSSVESMIGEDAKNIPVGTMLARVEQGLKVYSGIHRRCHEAQALEFRIVAQLNRDYLPAEYPYEVPGESRAIMASDFDERVDVLPVSDPNVVTHMQRQIIAEVVHEIAVQHPDVVNVREAVRRRLEALRVPDIDELIPPGEDKAPRLDPVSEAMRMLQGQAVQAYPEQDQLAHMQAHRQWWRTVPQELRGQLEPLYAAHQAEHLAHEYRRQVSQQIGMPVTGEELPLEQETAIANAVGLMSQELFLPADLGLGEAPSAPAAADIETAAKIKRADAETAAKIKRDDAVTAADLRRRAEEQAVTEAARAAGEVVGIEQALQRVPGNAGGQGVVRESGF
jgi:hypothetical protein